MAQGKEDPQPTPLKLTIDFPLQRIKNLLTKDAINDAGKWSINA